MSARPLTVGDRVPMFTLPDQHGQLVSLADLLTTGCVVLFFYPKDETPGCTAEACAFRDEHEALVQAGAAVVGVSADEVVSHRQFADRHRLPYRLLADPSRMLRGCFGVPRTLGFIDGRVTYIIDGSGVIRHVFNSQFRTRAHVAEALRIVGSLREMPAAAPGDAPGGST